MYPIIQTSTSINSYHLPLTLINAFFFFKSDIIFPTSSLLSHLFAYLHLIPCLLCCFSSQSPLCVHLLRHRKQTNKKHQQKQKGMDLLFHPCCWMWKKCTWLHFCFRSRFKQWTTLWRLLYFTALLLPLIQVSNSSSLTAVSYWFWLPWRLKVIPTQCPSF